MATITEDFVSFEVAKLLKEKGFDEQTRFAYTESGKADFSSLTRYWNQGSLYACPSQSMAMKWLREVHNRYIEICTDRAHNFKDIVFRPAIYDKELDCLWESDNFLTYEEACEAAIKYTLEHLIK